MKASGVAVNHGKEFLAGQLVAFVGAFEHGVGQVALGLVQTEYFFFDGVLRDKVIDSDVLALADAIGTVGGLLLDGGVPPWVEMNDIVGSREIQSQTTGLKADKEYGTLAALELLHQLVALTHRHRPVEVELWPFLLVQPL